MKKKNESENGAAIVILIVITGALFLLLSVAMQGFFASEKLNRSIMDECRTRAGKLSISYSSDKKR